MIYVVIFGIVLIDFKFSFVEGDSLMINLVVVIDFLDFFIDVVNGN